MDTSVLVRVLDPDDSLCAVALEAIHRLTKQGRALYIVPQNLFELWVVATRPNERNGLGMPPSLAATELLRMKKMLHFLPDTKDIYSIWEELVITNGVCGKPAHDARLVAAAMAHGLRGILTFDKTGFSRFPTISAVHPTET